MVSRGSPRRTRGQLPPRPAAGLAASSADCPSGYGCEAVTTGAGDVGPSGCNANDDSDCACTCDNGQVEAACQETCDPLASCPTACPPVGCQLRHLVNGNTCNATCVNDAVVTACPPVCGNGAVEAGETCDPVSACTAQSDACVGDANTIRTRSGMTGNCTFVCTTSARPCSATSDGVSQPPRRQRRPSAGITCTGADRDAPPARARPRTATRAAPPPTAPAASAAPTITTTTATACCDTEPLAHPGVGACFSAPRNGCGGYDYDCSGFEEGDQAYVVTPCGQDGLCDDGWDSSVPACGDSGSWQMCKINVKGVCVLASRTSVTELCR